MNLIQDLETKIKQEALEKEIQDLKNSVSKLLEGELMPNLFTFKSTDPDSPIISVNPRFIKVIKDKSGSDGTKSVILMEDGTYYNSSDTREELTKRANGEYKSSYIG